MTSVRISTRFGALIVIAAVLMTSALLAATLRATPSGLLVLSRLHLVVGGAGLMFMLGVVVGGLWLGRRSFRDDRHDGSGPDGPGSDHGKPEPPGSPPEVLDRQPDDLDRELEALLSGRWSPPAQTDPVPVHQARAGRHSASSSRLLRSCPESSRST